MLVGSDKLYWPAKIIHTHTHTHIYIYIYIYIYNIPSFRQGMWGFHKNLPSHSILGISFDLRPAIPIVVIERVVRFILVSVFWIRWFRAHRGLAYGARVRCWIFQLYPPNLPRKIPDGEWNFLHYWYKGYTAMSLSPEPRLLYPGVTTGMWGWLWLYIPYSLIELLCRVFVWSSFQFGGNEVQFISLLHYDKCKVIVLTPINGRHYRITQRAFGNWMHSARLGTLTSRCSRLTCNTLSLHSF